MAPVRPKRRPLRLAAAGSLAVDAATVEAVTALRRAGCEALLLKGPALAELLYDRGEERSWDDADLLVDPARHERALAVLASLGFRPAISDPLERGSVPHATAVFRPGGAGLGPEAIDLHRSFAGVGCSAEQLWASLDSERASIELFGRPIAVPSRPARLALVALHAASHGRAGERSLRDLQRAVARFGVAEWSRAAALAGAWRAQDYFVVGLRLDPAGARLLAELRVSTEPGIGARMRSPGMPRAQRSIEQLLRAEGPGARLRLIGRKVHPSPEVMRLWQPLARRGRAGLMLAYLWRPPWLLWQLGVASRAYLRARRR